ncbi:PREDICTED: SET and MYND domain-containing protein 4 [Prunus mume]|uniref:SET and MYND domain-containing protein 4 n=1 Tax=Prunus mume TaxID=102107 RepID=A0ABM0P458_PRUMU|nr:PREDICTED: SET and MYND domain-containing protein 4 [Prunus mume]
MEKLKSLVPETLKRMIGESSADDLPRTCSSLVDFLLHFEPFHQMVRDLADPEVALCGKNKEAALESKQKGNKCFLSGDYPNALDLYTQALIVAPMDAHEDRNLVATLYVNRASVLHKMGLLRECFRDCNRALQISSNYAKAWYRRGKANASMGNYKDTIRDLDVAKILELTMGGKRQIESEMKIILDQQNSTSNPSIQQYESTSDILDEPHPTGLRCVATPEKGRGMASTGDLPQASLVHTEDPFSMIILKPCRETHCHYCLNELPADKVPCTSCSIPLYCSQKCRIRAGGKMSWDYPNNQRIHENLSADLEKYIAETILNVDSETDTEHIPEHKHECKGVHWPAVLPSEIVLAGRVLVKSIIKRRGSADIFNLREILDLSHHYSKMPPERKLELHIYSAVLSYCLQYSDDFELPINGFSISQIVILISQIRVNSMTVVRMKSIDQHGLEDIGKFSSLGGGLTSNVEQVRVGQAIYTSGSLFNHSCQPNIHAYFLSRTLFIRTTEYVAAGVPLELSYGPQVGQWDCKDRVKFLEDEYSFRCQCSGCLKVNFSDLVLNAFHCVKPNCSGIVLQSSVVDCEKEKLKRLPNIITAGNMEPHLQAEEFINIDDIDRVAHHHMQINSLFHINPGLCLKCCSYHDLESSSAAANKAWIIIRRLQDAIVSKDVSSTILVDALSSLGVLRSTFHAYNRSIAEAEDNLAQVFCFVGELQPAMEHCKASIEILEKLYNPNHIVIGYELVKLSSIQLSLGDCAAVDSINRLCDIFSCYYGSHTYKIFPYLQFLKRREKQTSSLKHQQK